MVQPNAELQAQKTGSAILQNPRGEAHISSHKALSSHPREAGVVTVMVLEA
jgi:hypothetical protein